jgi:hypothetical protein
VTVPFYISRGGSRGLWDWSYGWNGAYRLLGYLSRLVLDSVELDTPFVYQAVPVSVY